MDKKSLRFAKEKWTEIIRNRKYYAICRSGAGELSGWPIRWESPSYKKVMAIWYSGLTENITVDSGLGDEFMSRRSKADLMSTGENKNRNRVYSGSVNILFVFGDYFKMYMVYLYGQIIVERRDDSE